MQIRELAGTNGQTARLTALTQFLLSRADDRQALKKISTQAFLKLAQNMAIPLTRGQLIDLVEQPPLNALIASVDDDYIKFAGSEEIDTENQMTVDQARQTVDSMAKRAIRF